MKKIEIYNCKIKKLTNLCWDIKNILIEKNLIKIIQKIEDYLNNLMKLQKYKLSVSMKKIQKFNIKAKKILKFCANVI